MKSTLLFAFVALGGVASAETVHGTLVDEAGKPIAGATLSGYALQGGPRDRKFSPLHAISDAKGAFILPNAPTLPTADLPIVLLARLTDGRFVSVNLTQDNGKAVVENRSTVLRIRATDPKGAPLPGANVRIDNVQMPFPYRESPAVRYSAVWSGKDLTKVTDAQGYATFAGLPPGAMLAVQADAPGRARQDMRIDRMTDLEERTVVLGKASVLSGRVLREGRPVAGASVLAATVVDRMGRQSRAVTDANGDYRFENLQPGHFSLALDLNELGTDWTAKGYEDLRLAEGGELNGLNFALEHGLLIQGRVLSKESGTPVAGIDVRAGGPGQSQVRGKTDAQGRFALRASPGDWYVAIDAVGDRPLDRQISLRTTIDEAHNPSLDMRIPDTALMPPVAHLQGTVVDVNGQPVAGAQVRALRGSMATTDASGRFRFEDETSPGSLVIASKGDAMSVRALEVRGDVPLALKLDGKATVVQGTVTDGDGKPLAGVDVAIVGQANGGSVSVPTATTDAAGKYRFEGLYGGVDSFYLWMKKSGYGAATIQNVRTTPGEAKTLPSATMALADGTIDGLVSEADGKPAVGVMVSSQVQDVPDAETDEQGRFHLTGVPRGRHFLVVWRARRGAGGGEGATGQTDVRIKLDPPTKEIPGLVTGSHEGQAAPPLDASEWIGGAFDPASLKGKIVIVDFWAVWCSPCVAALPKVQALAREYAARGVVVVGMHAPGTPKEKVAAFLKAKGLTYPNGLDRPNASGIGTTHQAFGPSGIPHVFLIDAKGHIVVDSNDIEDVERGLKKLLGEG